MNYVFVILSLEISFVRSWWITKTEVPLSTINIHLNTRHESCTCYHCTYLGIVFNQVFKNVLYRNLLSNPLFYARP